MRLFILRVGAIPSSPAFRIAAIALLALVLSCSRKHPLPGEIPRLGCEVTPSSLEFGTVAMGAAEERSFTVTNRGSDSLSGSISESCPDFQLVSGGSFQLGPGDQATFSLRFQPAAAGHHSCTLEIGPACSTLPAAGEGQDPAATCNVSSGALDFGTVNVGESADRTFKITNTGGGQLSGTVTESCAEFSIVGTAAYSLGNGEEATFTVRFAPTSGGAKNCTIDTGPTACADVSASGTGQAPNPPACQVSTATLSFGTVNVGESADRTFKITNTGGGQLSGTVTESCAEFSIVGTAGYSLGNGEEATFTVRFAPTSGGAKNCTIDTGPAACGDVNASGTGQAPNPPVCQVSTTTLSFDAVPIGEYADLTFTITNTGGGKLTGTVTESCLDFDVRGSGDYDLDATKSKAFTVRFTPLTTGSKDCTIDTGGDCADVAASGTGELPAPSCRLSTTMHQFGTVTVGNTAEGTLTITNLGGGTLSGTLSESCDGFAILGNPTYSLGPLQSANFTIEFAPTSTGDYQCPLNAGSACGTVTLRGTGGAP